MIKPIAVPHKSVGQSVPPSDEAIPLASPSFNRTAIDKMKRLLEQAEARDEAAALAAGLIPSSEPSQYIAVMQNILYTMAQEERYITEATKRITDSPNLPISKSLALLSPTLPPNTYLSSLPADQAMRQLVDGFRFRMEDEYIFNFQNLGVYGEEDPKPLFKAYLDLAEKNKAVPAWWSKEKRGEVEKLAGDEKGACWIGHSVERADVAGLYDGEMVMPLILRALGEKVYGESVIQK